jgi:DEAD/DEAH box helicase domain-containing protein
MLPPLLSHDIVTGLKQFLTTGFEPSNEHFSGLLKRFVDDESAWLKGPYLQLGLPFRVGERGTRYFSDFDLEYPGFTHQEQSWNRLCSDRQAANTLVATGTGSGKTECFLFPLLDHAARMKKQGGDSGKGIKALVIYPMNALATDQARRFAEEVARNPVFKDLRVGLFVGGGNTYSGGNPVMSPTEVITDREVMRKNPPDILLTNYKMLDYLLIRPKDRQLWAQNSPTTLRYIVIDELHTFDGAQGTDLALLLRRLQARLGSPDNHLIYAGTSATLGGGADSSALRDYAHQITGAPFAPDSVITEDRLSVAEFLGDTTIEHVFQAQDDLERLLSPESYASQEEAIAAWYQVFFPTVPAPASVTSTEFRIALTAKLKSHLLAVNLLKLMRGQIRPVDELVEEIQGPLPKAAQRSARLVLDALVALLGWARSPSNPRQSPVTIRLQLWIRELRRMVARVHGDPEQVRLQSSADLKSNPGGTFLPLVQCTECHTTGWLSIKSEGGSKANSDLEAIYNGWFSRSADVLRLYPGVYRQAHVEGIQRLVCGECGHLQGNGEHCEACGFEDLVKIFQITGTTTSTRGQTVYSWHDLTCPTCNSRDRLILLGARNATLGANIIERSWASPFNDDKKLIAFSDSVQDAAHRAGFFAARTYANNARTAIAKALIEQGAAQAPLPWADFLENLPQLWLERLGRERFVTEFIGPNMMWQREWENLSQGNEPLAERSHMPQKVGKRLGWQAFAEFTYLSRRGRTLEKYGIATLQLDTAALKNVCQALAPALANQLGLRVSERSLLQWAWGFLTHLRQCGAVYHPELSAYAEDGNIFALQKTRGRGEWLPNMGAFTPRPKWLSLGQHSYFERISALPGNWYNAWMQTLFLRDGCLLQRNQTNDVYDALIRLLLEEGLLVKVESDRFGPSVALNDRRLSLTQQVCHLTTAAGLRPLCVPLADVDDLIDLPCPDAMAETYTETVSQDAKRVQFYAHSDIRRVIAAEHTGLLEREPREKLEQRFKATPGQVQPWFENLLSATPTLEMGVDIGSLSSVMLCSVPPNQASFLQRIGRAGRRDGNALATTLADGSSPHDLYFFADTDEMLKGEVTPPGIFLEAAEVLRRQLFAFCLDDWVSSGIKETALPDKTSSALDAVNAKDEARFPYTLMQHMLIHEQSLLDRFVKLLGDDTGERVRPQLEAMLQGSSETDALRVSLLKILEELLAERSVYKKRRQKLQQDINALKAQPQDDETRAQIDHLDRQRGIAQQQARAIDDRELLNTLTDAGLIPNYAFPEAGIQLKSLLWRKKMEGEEAQGNYITLPAITYERPASSALSEFAPENRFFANQRKVEINQIDMQLAQPEEWRLCPSCQFMQNLELEADSHSACPSCDDVMWANISQKRTLLRFRQAIANSEDTRARIDDSAEDREPKFYVRQLLTSFKPQNVEVAWRLKSDSLPFGFEFIRSAVFRDINFGERGRNGESLKVANKETPRPGFKLCRHCGMVQTPPRKSADEDGGEKAQTHAYDCPVREEVDPGNLVECLYLYREFSSEALRILVPFTKVGMNDQVIQSFMAALQLGLKKRFGGKVDHLRMTTYEEVGINDAPSRHFIMLYDSVPGGTGYLHQLLSQEAQTLGQVLQLAHAHLSACSCQSDPEKDGCYRCVYQYRLGRAMAQVSRDCAREILEELLGSLDQLEKVASIQDIQVNSHFDSVLEAQFIGALKRLGSEPNMPTVRIVKDIVNGKSGYQLTVDKEQYWIEVQVPLGPENGVAVSSKPDTVIWPKRSHSARRPIAIFTDGWAYHKDILADDALKRSALVASGKFWVWSVSWEDVKAALDGSAKTDLDSPFGSHTLHNNVPTTLQVDMSLMQQNAVATLLDWLAKPVLDSGDGFVARQLQNMQGLTVRMLLNPKAPDLYEPLKADLDTLWQQLPEPLQRLPEASHPACSPIDKEPRIRLYWPQAWSKPRYQIAPTTGMLVLDDRAIDDKHSQKPWRRWISWYNHLQVLPGVWLMTTRGLARNDYDALASPLPGTAPAPISGDQLAWEKALNSAVEAVRPGLIELGKLGDVPPDDFGLELPDATGDLVIEAEAAWTAAQVALLTPGQEDCADAWTQQGWKVVCTSSPTWPAQAHELLNAKKD